MARKRRAKRPCKRVRSVNVSFRMDEEHAKRLDTLVSLSGLTKQEYIECRLLDESVTVVPSSRIAASLSQWMQAIYRELITARDDERALDADVVWMARSIAEEFSAISSAGQTRNANETMRSIERS